MQARRAYTRARVAHLQATRKGTTMFGAPLAPPTQVTLVPSISNERDATLRRLQNELAIATARYNDMRRPLIYALHGEPAYRAIFLARKDIQRTITVLLNDGTATDGARIGLANKAMQLGGQLTRAEALALSLDPAIEDARLAMSEASRRLRQYLDTLHVATGMPSRMDPMLAPPPTAEEVEKARARVQAADRRLADALMRESALEQVRVMRVRQQQLGKPVSMFGR